ncbi:aldo/keto reductase [Mucilaginibacter daejeonensis]|uniref:aldo/keto reductase n=1 Tax=Mucilaginibacter daejeonensis TaxID=398049 RepID=UPI001D1768D0|nr:aldo/keto reductase [Mucilaginibacter daejeonensis]UEG55205.1 aldo/keto reductase [Mucilaginibacter daejeonensis]
MSETPPQDSITLPKVIFGTSGLGNLYVALPHEEKRAIVKAYIESSPKPAVFDSAGKYGAGQALESLGKCLEDLNVDPADVLISNKLAWVRSELITPEPTFEPGVWKDLKFDAVQKISYEGIMECYEQGNELLGKYHSQYVSVHDPDEYWAAATDNTDREKRYQDVLDAYRALTELKTQGKAQAVGVGAKDWRSIQRIDQDVKLDWVMIANSMTVHSHPDDLLAFMRKLRDQGTVVINSAVFNGGFLTGGDYYNYHLIDKESADGQALYTWRERFYDVCKTHSVEPAAACLQFGLAAPGVKSVALSTSNPKRIPHNIALVDAHIPEQFWQDLLDQHLITEQGYELVKK